MYVEAYETLKSLIKVLQHALFCHVCNRSLRIISVKLFLFYHLINSLLTELSRSVWDNLELSRVYRQVVCHNNNINNNKTRTWLKANNDNDNDNDYDNDNDNDNDEYLSCNGRFSIYFILLLNVLSLEEDRAKYRDLLVRNRRLREVTGLRDIDKSRYFVKTEVDN